MFDKKTENKKISQKKTDPKWNSAGRIGKSPFAVERFLRK